MGTIIEASATATAGAHRRSLTPGALELADAAARTCLERAHRTAEELGVLINAGVFHDMILSEPAFASLIQEDIGANLGHPSGARSRNVFVRRLQRGLWPSDRHSPCRRHACIGNGRARDGGRERHGPGTRVSEGFTFPGVGGAVLLSADDSRAGFTAFQFATFPEFAELFQSYVDWQEDPRGGLAGHGRNILTVEIAESYTARALECAESTVRELAGAQALDLGEVDLLVATASVPGFAEGLAARLGVPAERVALPPDGLAGTHTAAPAVALESVRLAPASTALFVSAGAGITVAVALYRA